MSGFMADFDWLQGASPAFRLMIATSWLGPESCERNQEERIRQAIDAGPDWAEYLSLVERHQIPALSWAALSRVQGISVPEFVQRELQKRSRACRIHGMQRSLVLADVLREFNCAGIPVMPLKGPVLSHELYGDVGLRASDDLDVQVPREDLRRAMACLESTGWRPGSDFCAMTPRQWESFLRNDYEMLFTRAGCSLELHWRNHWETADATSARWARSTAGVWQGHSIRKMSAGDLALFLCVHGAYHVWSSAKWLSDVARAHSIGRLDWRAAVHEARSAGLEGVCP
ncbi:MAG: nucleotidyltransferase family protein, partial [Acidobacteriaceae bacterium]